MGSSHQNPVAWSAAASGGQRDQQPGHPAGEEHLDGAGLEPVADSLQSVGVTGGSEPVGSSVKAMPALMAWHLAHSCR
jgi:hypothetical protein